MRRRHLIASAVVAAAFGWSVWNSPGRAVFARHETKQEKTSRQPGGIFVEEGGVIKRRQAGEAGGSKDGKQPQMEALKGRLIRPLVSEGEMGPTAPESGAFDLRPGDLIEIECAIPKNRDNDLTFNVEDEKVMKILPAGVRQLVPMAMVAGEPKPITGMVRAVAIFQAQDIGKTMIRLNLGRRQYQYRIEVRRDQEAPSGK